MDVWAKQRGKVRVVNCGVVHDYTAHPDEPLDVVLAMHNRITGTPLLRYAQGGKEVDTRASLSQLSKQGITLAALPPRHDRWLGRKWTPMAQQMQAVQLKPLTERYPDIKLHPRPVDRVEPPRTSCRNYSPTALAPTARLRPPDMSNGFPGTPAPVWQFRQHAPMLDYLCMLPRSGPS